MTHELDCSHMTTSNNSNQRSSRYIALENNKSDESMRHEIKETVG